MRSIPACNGVGIAGALHEMIDTDFEAAIRAAFSAGEFARTRKLWSEWAGQTEAAIRNRSASAGTLARMRALVDWARLVTLAFRARTSARLASLHAAAAYSAQPAPRAVSFRASL
jgi:hypothetical protein